MDGRAAGPGSFPSFDWISFHARERPDKIAVVNQATGRSLSFAEFNARIDAVAGHLHHHLGVSSGDRVAVLAHNDSNIFELQFACWRLGAIMVPLNWRLALAELALVVNDCGPVVLVSDATTDAVAAHVVSDHGIAGWLAWGASHSAPGDYEAAATGSAEPWPPYQPTLDTILELVYTSGTSGQPKGVIQTHGMTFWNVVNGMMTYAYGQDMVNLVCAPLFHTAALNVCGNPTFYWGGTNVILPKFDAAEVLLLLASDEVAITHFVAVPSQFEFISQLDVFASARFPALRTAGVGGAVVTDTLLRKWLERGVVLQQVYGMTETGVFCLSQTRAEALDHPGSTGRPGMHVACRVVDDTGADVGPGRVGQLLIKSPSVTPGYWRKPRETAEAIRDGWLHTGDLVRHDADGFFFIVDGLKDMYISGGENVYPAEIENALASLPGVAEVAVIGVADDRWGEAGMAFVRPQPGWQLDETAVRDHCRSLLAGYKVPKWVCFVAELPRSGAGKVLKGELQRLFSEHIT